MGLLYPHPLLFSASDPVVSTAGTVGLMGVVGVVGTAVGWAFSKYADWRANRRKELKEDEETTISRLEKIVDRLDRELSQRGAELDKLQQAYQRVLVREGRMMEWIKITSGILRAKNIDHPPWSDEPTGDTGNHPSLTGVVMPATPPITPSRTTDGTKS